MKASETAVRAEFIVLVALLTAMVAMSIDAMLPALGNIAGDLGAKSPNDRQLVLTVFFAGMTLGTLVYGPVSDSFGGHPPLWTLGAWLAATFFCSGILFGNYNAIAMEPMGRIAGIAAAVTGSLSSAVALAIGGVIGLFYDGTVIPLAAAFAGCGIVAFMLTEWAERRRG